MRWPSPPPPRDPVYDGGEPGHTSLDLPGTAVWRGVSGDAEYWRGHVHEQAAYRFYMDDRLPEAVEAAEEALECGTRHSMWPVKLLGLAIAELAAMDEGAHMQRLPFTFDVAAIRAEPLAAEMSSLAERVESVLQVERPATRIAVLGEEPAEREVGSQWAYMAPKKDYLKVCVLQAATQDAETLSQAFTEEYARAIIHEVTDGRGPGVVLWGVPAWLARTDVGNGPTARGHEGLRLRDAEHALRPGAGVDDQTFQAAVKTSLEVTGRLVDEHGTLALSEFVAALARWDLPRAFKRTFGRSYRSFARDVDREPAATGTGARGEG